MKLGMNMLLWASHVTEAHYPIFEKIKKAGFDGVELPLFEGDAAHFTAIGAELARQGLGCTTVTCLSTDANPISDDAAVRQASHGLRQAGNIVGQVFPGEVATHDEFTFDRELVLRDGQWVVQQVL